MKFHVCNLLVCCLFIIDGYSQIYVGSKSYESTPSFKFSQNSNGLNSFSYALVSIGKRNNTQGMIMISMSSLQGGLKKGIIIYLEDGTAISCVDRGLFDEVDNKTMGIWYLSEGDVNKMKRSDISSIRYSILENGFSLTSYTIVNKFNSRFSNSPFPSTNDTDGHIKQLFN